MPEGSGFDVTADTLTLNFDNNVDVVELYEAKACKSRGGKRVTNMAGITLISGLGTTSLKYQLDQAVLDNTEVYTVAGQKGILKFCVYAATTVDDTEDGTQVGFTEVETEVCARV